MSLFLSFLCLLASGVTLIGRLYFKAGLISSLPLFSPVAFAFIGLIIAAIEYKGRKTKKKKKRPMALIIGNSILGIASALYWIYALLF